MADASVNLKKKLAWNSVDAQRFLTILSGLFMHIARRWLKTPAILSMVTLSYGLMATDWPQYRGPSQDGVSTEKADLNWPAGGPKVLWKVPTRLGFSCFSISEGKVFTQVVREVDGQPKEGCFALDAAKGSELWFAALATGRYDGSGNAGTESNKGGDGPRSTPCVSDGRVYVFTPDLVLHCLEAPTGKPLWTKNLIKEHAGRNIGWNSAASVAVDGDLVFVAGGGPGQSLLAFNKTSGAVVWKAHDEKMTHSTPVVATVHGVRQVIFFLQSGLLSVDVKDGRALWKYPFPYNVSTATSPIVAGDVVYCSAGYGVGGGACRVIQNGAQFAAQELWRIPGDKLVANHWSTPVCRNGYLYGMFSFKKYAVGPLKCVELSTGKVKWEQPGFGAGNVMLVQDKLIALADDGQVVAVNATPTAYQEICRAKVLEGKCWSTPAFSNGRIYVRSTKEGACLDLSGK
jgi:outer membrane protein assembly factor BamB